MYTKAHKKANEKYRKEKCFDKEIQLRIEEDADIIESIEKAVSMGYTKMEWLRAVFEGKRLDKE